MPTLQIVTASTRPGRSGPHVAAWAEAIARTHGAFTVEAVDLAAVGLPLFDEPHHPRLGQYEHDHTKAWSATVQRADAFVFVTPEYNYGPPPSLLNALTFLSREWAYKPVGFVSYGGISGGTRGVQVTKMVVTTLSMMPLPEAVALPFFSQHLDRETGGFDPGELAERAAQAMLDALVRWTNALAPLRAA